MSAMTEMSVTARNDLHAPIVVAIGNSAEEESALLFASAEALRTQRPLRVVHVLPELGPRAARGPLVTYESASSIGHRLVVRATTRLQELTEGQVRVDPQLLSGGAAEELARLSESAHMVVLEHRSLGRLHRVFTGSVSAGVAAHSRAEVVVVPELWRPSVGFINRVLVGVEDWHAEAALFEHAFGTADEHEASLRVVHAWKLPAVYQDALVDDTAVEQWRHAVSVDIEAALAEARRAHPSVKISVDVLHDWPADALLEGSREADLLVVGRRETAHPRMHHLGSLTRALLRGAECPVDVVPVP